MKDLVSYIMCVLMHLTGESSIADAARFFAYKAIKIFIPLAAITFIVSLIPGCSPLRQINKLLSYKRALIGNIIAALPGVVILFYSFSASTLVTGSVEAGVQPGTTFSFPASSQGYLFNSVL